MNDAKKEIQPNVKWAKEPLRDKTDKELQLILDSLKISKPYKELITKYRDNFGQHISEIGVIPDAQFEIELKKDAIPYYTQPYPQPYDTEEEIKKQTKELLEQGLIEPADNSEWQASCTGVPKKEDKVTGKVEWRIVQDYRQLNDRTKTIQMVFPRIEDIMVRVGKYKYFTTFDMLSGYYHIMIPEKYRPYMAYGVAGMGSFQPTRMFFGLKNAPAYYQKTIQRILGNIILQDWAAVYIDDIVIGANTKEDLLDRTEQVLIKIKNGGLKAKLSKCEFEKERVELLGWIISQNKREINEKRVKAIKDWKYGEKMESFLGVLTFIGKFLPIKAQLMMPIRETVERTINKKENKIGIAKRPPTDKEAMAAFETIKELITGDKFIVNPEWNKPVEIYTDASDYGIGGVIKQEHGIIAYYSKTFKENERRWTIPKKELYAIQKTIEDNINLLRPYTIGMIKVFCDNRSVVDLFKNNNKKKTIDKSALSIFEKIMIWDILIEHIPGKENSIADALSRYKENIDAHMSNKIPKINKDPDTTINDKHENNTNMINNITNKLKSPRKSKMERRLNKYEYNRREQEDHTKNN
jgi:hypothetical protein